MKDHEIDALVRYRLEQAGAALADARFLVEGNRSPQSIINRAYYAMFYAALALLQKVGKVPSKHAGAISLFDTEFVQKRIFPRELSQDFHKAFELRQASDYRVFDSPSRGSAEDMCAKAARFIEAVKAHLLGADQGEDAAGGGTRPAE